MRIRYGVGGAVGDGFEVFRGIGGVSAFTLVSCLGSRVEREWGVKLRISRKVSVVVGGFFGVGGD